MVAGEKDETRREGRVLGIMQGCRPDRRSVLAQSARTRRHACGHPGGGLVRDGGVGGQVLHEARMVARASRCDKRHGLTWVPITGVTPTRMRKRRPGSWASLERYFVPRHV